MRNLIFGSTVWVIRVGLVSIIWTTQTSTMHFCAMYFCNVVYDRPWQSCVFQNCVESFGNFFFFRQKCFFLNNIYLQTVWKRSGGWLYDVTFEFILSLESQTNDDTGWMDSNKRWATFSKLSCSNAPVVAVIIRLICSPGLTLFSLCLLVVHEHFDITFEVTEAATYIKLRHPKKNLLILFYISFSLCYQRCFISY